MEKLPPHLKTKGKPLGLWDPGKKRLPVGYLAEYAETCNYPGRYMTFDRLTEKLSR